MRALLLSIFIAVAALATPIKADIPKPQTVAETLELMLPRILPSYPEARIDPVANNIRLDQAGGAVINPDNIHSVLRTIDDGAAREAELDAFIATLITAFASNGRDAGDVPLDRVYPVLRHTDFARNPDSTLGGAAMFAQPYLGDMILVYAIDYPTHVDYVTQADIGLNGISAETLQAAGTRNLEGKIAITQFQQTDRFIMAVADGFYESSLVVETGLWESISRQLGDDLVMIVPARDVLVFVPASDAEGVAALEGIKQNVLSQGSHQLSTLTYSWTGGAWQVLTR